MAHILYRCLGCNGTMSCYTEKGMDLPKFCHTCDRSLSSPEKSEIIHKVNEQNRKEREEAEERLRADRQQEQLEARRLRLRKLSIAVILLIVLGALAVGAVGAYHFGLLDEALYRR